MWSLIGHHCKQHIFRLSIKLISFDLFVYNVSSLVFQKSSVFNHKEQVSGTIFARWFRKPNSYKLIRHIVQEFWDSSRVYVETYNRSIRVAAVSQRAWDNLPSFFLAKLKSLRLFMTAWYISSKYINISGPISTPLLEQWEFHKILVPNQWYVVPHNYEAIFQLSLKVSGILLFDYHVLVKGFAMADH